ARREDGPSAAHTHLQGVRWCQVSEAADGAGCDPRAWRRFDVALDHNLGSSPRTPLLARRKAATADLLSVPGVAAAVHLRVTAAYGRASGAVRARRAAMGRLADDLDRQGDIGEAAVRQIIRG
ncbi:hypothetical protein, partial [Methylobacterium radiotolerans]|uniref:hypothetical protein n=1 Tax=Methylobacterium radiotolerans TaxID=31998 RepID=UPI000B91F6FB